MTRLLRCPVRSWGVGVLLIHFAAVVQAEALSFNAALELALRESPDLTAKTAEIDAAEHAATPAGALPDPKLALGIENVPIEGADRYRLDQDAMTMGRLALMQEFPNRTKREARLAAAQNRVDMAEARARVTQQIVHRETAVAWIARHTLEQQLARMEALSAENLLFDAAVRARLTSGQTTAAEVLAPRQEAALIDERRDALRARREQAIADLKRWIGAAADAPLAGEPPEWSLVRDDLLHALHQHPDLAVLDSQQRVLDAELREARAAKQPGWALELAYQLRDAQFGDMVSLQIAIDVPIFPGARQNPQIAAKHAATAALTAEREALLREHIALLETDLAQYQRLVQALRRQREVLLPLAEEKVALIMAAWQGGKSSLSELITARRERIVAELDAVAFEGERRQVAARLHYTYSDAAGAQP